MNLKWHLLGRMTALGALCWLAVSVYLLAGAGQRAAAEAAAYADRVQERMEIDLARQMSAASAGRRFPDLSRVAADLPERLCFRYESLNGERAEQGCEDDAAVSATPAWLPRLGRTLIPQADVLQRDVRLWSQHAGTLSFMPDHRRLLDRQLRTTGELLALAAVLVAALGGLVYWMVSRALAPATHIVATLDGLMAAGARAPPAPAGSRIRELARIDDGIRRLAQRLASISATRDRLLDQLLCLQESERRELAHTLHEELGQAIAAVAVHTACMRASLPGEHAGLDALDQSVDCLQNSLRHLLLRVRPPLLEQQGLAAALNDLVRGWRARVHGPELELRLDPQLPQHLDDDRALCIYRLVQECLNNIGRHAAHCRSATIQVCCTAEGLRAVVANDRSVDDRARPGSGMGLQLLAERLRALGGRLEIQRDARRFGVAAHLPDPQLR